MLLVFALLCATNIVSAQIIINTTSVGDGYFNDVTGGAYDGFYSTDANNSVNYTYYGYSDSMNRNTSYVQFNISSLSGFTVSGVTLNIYLTQAAYMTGSTLSAGYIYHVADSSSANGNASQQLGGSDLVYTLESDGTGWLSVDITSLLQADIDAGYTYSCFSFSADASGDYSNRYAGYAFASYDAASNHPYINVESIPEPSTYAAILGAAMLPLVFFRKRMLKA